MSDELREDVRVFLRRISLIPTKPVEAGTPQEAREAFVASARRTDLPVGDLATVGDFEIPGPVESMAARLFDARVARPEGPIVVWFHGGGFVTGGLDTHGGFAAQMARELDLPVVLVDYRLAPEGPFPAPQDDAEAAARWLADNTMHLGLHVTGLVVGGDSGGGTLALVTVQALRDRPASVPVLAQIAFYPTTDESKTYPSVAQFGEGYLLTEKTRVWYREHYRPERTNPRASPLLGNLHGLPPTVIMTASHDPVRDQGVAYAQKLQAARVPTTWLEAAGNVHAFVVLRKVIPSSQQDVSAALAALRRYLP